MSAAPILTLGLGSFSGAARVLLQGLAATGAPAASTTLGRARSGARKVETARRVRKLR